MLWGPGVVRKLWVYAPQNQVSIILYKKPTFLEILNLSQWLSHNLLTNFKGIIGFWIYLVSTKNCIILHTILEVFNKHSLSTCN